MKLKLLKIKHETKDTFSLILEKPQNFNFYPGQYLDVELQLVIPTKVGIHTNESRIFSISSSPSEDFIMLTYKTGISIYKQKMFSLKPGDIIQSSHPAGTVVIDASSPIVMIAGGIGIAPHRSMLKWAVDRKLDAAITLIYSNSDEDIIFKKELDSWQKQLPNLKIHYVITSRDGRLTKEGFEKLYPRPYTPDPIFYLAGAPGMVDTFENILLSLGVESFNIRTDRFDGY